MSAHYAEDLGTFAATPQQRRYALTAALVALLIAVAILPIARVAAAIVPAFFPAFATAIMLTDAMTAYLLFRQYATGRRRSMAFLAAAYLFTSAIVVPHLLGFPGAFTKTGLFGAAPQTAVWLWVAWHSGFPLFLLAYVVMYVRERRADSPGPRWYGRALAFATISIAGALAFGAFRFGNQLPALISNGSYGALITSGVGPAILIVSLSSTIALAAVTRMRTAAHLWLSVAAFAMTIDIGITLLGGARYSFGWYAARLDSLLAASVVLGALLYEAARLGQRVARAERRLRALVDGVADALVAVDAQGRIVSFNPAASMLFGLGSRDAIGASLATLIPAYASVATGTMNVLETDGVDRNGRTIPLELAFGGVDASDAMTIVARDITQRKRAELAIAGARDRAIEAARVKAQFLATMSHEIRTPINAVIGMTELLIEGDLTTEQREYSETVQSSAQALLGIINDILDFSKLEVGRLAIDTIPFSPIEAVEAAADILASNARKKRLSLVTYVAPDVPPLLVGDANRIRQILLNLIGNAIKFTASGNVVVRCSVDRPEGDFTVVRFSVSDTGIGVSPENVAKLFAPFAQAEGSTSRRYGGTGLGLSISKQLVELMDGEIGVESRPGAGATFWFTARLERVDSDFDVPVSSLRNARVLIVDDDGVSRQILEQYLLSWGIIGTGTASAAHALLLLEAAARRGAPFHAALIDYFMPDVDGIGLGTAIKASPPIASLPLILVTAFDEPGRGRDAIERGFSAYLRKPLRQSALYDALAAAIAHTDRDAEPVANEAVPVAHHDDVLILLAEDHPVNQKLALQQLKKLGYRAHAVNNGREALDALEHTEFSLVLMDCQMPELDGYDATRAIRRREASRGVHVPIVALTANALAGDRDACIAAGMDDYLSKPVQLSELRAMIERYATHG